MSGNGCPVWRWVSVVLQMDVPPLSIPSDHIATVKKQTLPPSKLPSGKSGSQLKRPVPCGRTVLTTPVKVSCPTLSIRSAFFLFSI